MSNKYFVAFLIISQEGGGSHHVIPETHDVEGFVFGENEARSICIAKNAALGNGIDITDDDWAETMNAANDESVVWFYEKIKWLSFKELEGKDDGKGKHNSTF